MVSANVQFGAVLADPSMMTHSTPDLSHFQSVDPNAIWPRQDAYHAVERSALEKCTARSFFLCWSFVDPSQWIWHYDITENSIPRDRLHEFTERNLSTFFMRGFHRAIIFRTSLFSDRISALPITNASCYALLLGIGSPRGGKQVKLVGTPRIKPSSKLLEAIWTTWKRFATTNLRNRKPEFLMF